MHMNMHKLPSIVSRLGQPHMHWPNTKTLQGKVGWSHKYKVVSSCADKAVTYLIVYWISFAQKILSDRIILGLDCTE